MLCGGFLARGPAAEESFPHWYLSGADSGQLTPPEPEAIRAALRELGHREGENIVIEYRHAGNRDRYPEAAAELVRLKVDLILVAGGTTPPI